MIFGFEVKEVRKALVAVIYVAFALGMLIFGAPKVGFEHAVLAIVGPLFMVYGVFNAKNHTPDEVAKSLEALKAAVFSALAYVVTVPNSYGEAITMLIAGVVVAYGVRLTPNAGRGAPGNGAPAAPRGPPNEKVPAVSA